MQTCDRHEDMVRMVAENTALTAATLEEVKEIKGDVKGLSHIVAEQTGAASAAKTGVAWLVGCAGVAIALVTLAMKVLG